MKRFLNYILIVFVNLIPYCKGCFPTSSSDSSPDLVTGSMTGNTGTTLPNDPTCLCGTFPTSGSLIATPPIVIINPFTCLITVTLQCINLLTPIIEFNGNTAYQFPTPPPFTVTCGGTGQYTFIDVTLTTVIVSSATCVL